MKPEYETWAQALKGTGAGLIAAVALLPLPIYLLAYLYGQMQHLVRWFQSLSGLGHTFGQIAWGLLGMTVFHLHWFVIIWLVCAAWNWLAKSFSDSIAEGVKKGCKSNRGFTNN